MRYRHYLREASGGRFPPRILCVDPIGRLNQSEKDRSQYTESVRGWYAESLLLRDGAYTHHAGIVGMRVDGFWQTLRSMLARSGVTLVLSWQCARAWSLLGMWEEIERGRLLLDADPERRTVDTTSGVRGMPQSEDAIPVYPGSAGMRGLHRKDEGFLIAEDPPNVLRARIPGLPGKLLWIDCRNFGAECPVDTDRGALVVSHLTSWCASLHSALKDYRLGSMKATAGTQALHGWRTGFHVTGLYVHNHQRALKMEDDGYYGGRCECFRLGKIDEPVYMLDVRSMYGWAMVKCEQAVSLEGYTDDPVLATEKTFARPMACLSDVLLEYDKPIAPVRYNGLLVFPIGKYRTGLAGPELSLAVELGAVKKVYRCAWYTLGKPLEVYARNIYHLRCYADYLGRKMLEQTAKQLLVSIAGKMGQRERRWTYRPEMIAPSPYCYWYGARKDGSTCRYRSIAGRVERDDSGGWGPESVPSIACWITSAARVRLWELMEQAGRENVYYVDTDCLIVNERGADNLYYAYTADSKALGALTLRDKGSSAHIYGVKHYKIGYKLVYAGHPKGVLVSARDGTNYWYLPSPAMQMYQGCKPSTQAVLTDWARAPEYRHGIVNSDGSVSAFVLNEKE